MALPAVEFAMLIDDNDIDLFVQKRFVEINKFAGRVITYTSASLAVSSLMTAEAAAIPNLIFLDLNMPEMDGFSFLENFKRLPQSVRDKSKVVVVTSSSSHSDKERAMGFESVIHFISKPLSDKALLQIRDKFGAISNS